MAARTGGPEWQSEDLCTQCQSVNLTQICSNGSRYGTDVSLCIFENSNCPLCRFLASKLHRRDAGSEGSVTVGLSRHVINGVDHVCIQHDQQFEYILQMTDGEFLKEPNRIGQFRQINPSQIDYDMIRKWIAHCRGTHGKSCQMLMAKPLRIAKFRVLDCKIETVVECTEFSEYVALSYVWSSSSNVEDKHQDLLSNPVIKDAMHVTLQLGFQYIWVDQLCVDQRDAEDMSCQLSQMNTICMLLTRRET